MARVRREGELRAMVDAMATTRMRGDATMRRKYAELEKLTLAASSGNRPPSLLGRGKAVGESLVPKSMTCRPAHPAHPAWDSAGESQTNQRREPLCHSVFSARMRARADRPAALALQPH